MPQMAPYNWLILMMYFNLILMFFLSFNNYLILSNFYIINNFFKNYYKLKW